MKHHNNLTDDQIHKPKGFQGAPNRSLMIKNSQGSLEWKEGNYTSSVSITCVAGVDLHNMYFCLQSSYDTIKYAVHFKMDASFSSFSTPSGYDAAIEVDCTATGVNSTKEEVAAYLHAVLYAHADFISGLDIHKIITVTGLTSAADPFDVSTDFTIVTTQTKITSEFLSTDSSGDIAWTATTPHTPEGTEVKSTGEAGGTKVLTEDGSGGATWETPTGGGLVTSLTTTGTSGVSSLSAGVLNVPNYANTTSIALTTTGTSGASTWNGTTLNIPQYSGGGGTTEHNTTTSWRGCVQLAGGELNVAYGMTIDCDGRGVDFLHTVNFGGFSPVVSSVVNQKIIEAATINITTNGTTNYAWTGRIFAKGATAAGSISLYRATIDCEGEIPSSHDLTLLYKIDYPALDAGKVFCWHEIYTFLASLSKEDMIVPLIAQSGEGVTDIVYTNTVELTHPHEEGHGLEDDRGRGR
jgi:hypothetical protein